jgi:hypothetical protein
VDRVRKRSTTAVAVAQLVESRIVIPVVVGSNPISHPNFSCYIRAAGLRRGHAHLGGGAAADFAKEAKGVGAHF